MKITIVKKLKGHPCCELHFDKKTGIAWVENGSSGTGHSAHPNINSSGSASGMIKNGYWHKDDVIKKSHGYTYNTSHLATSDGLDEIARQHCRCGGRH